MRRTSSAIAQASFDFVCFSRKFTRSPRLLVKIFARIAIELATPFLKMFGSGHTIVAEVYGRRMRMPAEHFLPGILSVYPHYNRPLALAVEAVHKSSGNQELAVIDIGANIGDTAAIIEQRLPGVCTYLCIEPDSDLAAICAENVSHLKIEIKQCFVGEQEGALVHLEDDGQANPSMELIFDANAGADQQVQATQGKLMRLDTLAGPFAQTQGKVSFIKVDTEGYDFAILRSGIKLLQQFKPPLFLEWSPKLLIDLHEDPLAGFDYLKALGYRHFVFFRNIGDFYCRISDPDTLFLRSLGAHIGDLYFDIFASTSEAICDELVELSIAATEDKDYSPLHR